MLKVPNTEKEIVQLSRGDSLKTALNAFRSFKISHLPVIESNKLVGIVTKSNVTDYIYRAAEEFTDKTIGQVFEETAVEKFMQKPVVTIGKDDELWDIVSRFEKEGVGAVMVKNQNQIIGILTERDFLQVIREALDGEGEKSGAALAKIKQMLFDKDYNHMERLYSEIGL